MNQRGRESLDVLDEAIRRDRKECGLPEEEVPEAGLTQDEIENGRLARRQSK